MRYDQSKAIKRLMRNRVTVRGSSIYFDPLKQNVGIKVLGALDYLVNHCEFVWVKESKTSRPRRST